MMSRACTYASVNALDSVKTVYTTAETWGELRKEVMDIDLLASKMTPWAKTADDIDGFALESSSDRLPSGDFRIVFLVQKNDSGINN